MEPLIRAVHKYPCLWNSAAIEYRDQELKDAAWAEVMKETGLPTVKEVKLKWKKLRDSYRDALKRQSEMAARDPSGAAKKAYPWKYMSAMHFLQPHMSVRKKPADSPPPQPPPTNGHERSSDSSSSEDEPAVAPAAKRRRPDERLDLIDKKIEYLCKEQGRRQLAEAAVAAERRRDAPDPLDIFFNSMCQYTKRLPYATQIKIKKVMFAAVTEAEEAALAEQASYASLWARDASSDSSDAADDEDRKPAS